MPIPQPQPVLAPLTPAAIFLVVTIDAGGEEVVHDALAGDLRVGARQSGFASPPRTCRWSPRSARTPGTGCSTARDRPSCTRSSSWTAPAQGAGNARRPVVPCSGRDAGRLLRAGQPHSAVDGRRGDRGRRGARVPVLRQPRSARVRRRHREPGRRAGGLGHQIGDEDPEFAGGMLRARAEVSARHGRHGIRCRLPSRSA